MATNPFFNNFNSSPEQKLLADLNIEAIRQYGYDMLYLPRRQGNYSDVRNEDTMSYFDTAYPIEMYIKSVDGFEGEGSFLSKFGLEVRDRVTLSVARRRFSEDIGTPENISRPKEGDLIWFTMTNKLFEINYVDNRAIFYPLGSLPLFDLTCEVFEYSMEHFNTGIPAIDAIQTEYSIDQIPHIIRDIDGDPTYNPDGSYALDAAFDMETIDPGWDNEVTQEEAKTLVNINIKDPYKRT